MPPRTPRSSIPPSSPSSTLVVFASATGDMFSPDQRAAFQRRIAAGHGFVGLHGAGDGSHPAWYQALLGYGSYAGHPGGADQFQTGDLILRSHASRHPRVCPRAGAGPRNIIPGRRRP